MAHPLIRPSARSRTVVLAGLAGVLVLGTTPAAAAIPHLTGTVEDLCATPEAPAAPLAPVVDPACEVAADAVGEVEGVAEATAAVVPDAVTAPVEAVAAPVIELLPAVVADAVPPPAEEPAPEAPVAPADEEDAPADEEDAPAAVAAEPSPATGAVVPTGPTEVKVEAAGKSPEEIMEPQAPAADGRVVGAPTLQQTDLGALGGNIAAIASQSGLTLQPYDSPMVSTPTQMDVPRVAGAPMTTASPVAAIAAEAMTLAGDTVLPQTSGQAAMVTMTGVALVMAAGYGLRRRAQLLTVATLDED